MNEQRIEYLVSRFPRTSETFIVREIDGLARRDNWSVGVRSLFPSPDTTVHDIAKPWVPKLVRPSISAGFSGLAWALFTRPIRLISSLLVICNAFARKPGHLVRNLYAVLIACAHARDLRGADANVRIHAHYATYPATAAWMCRRLVGVPYSITAHAHDLYVQQCMLQRLVADADFVVTISEFNREFIERHAGTVTPIHVLHAGIDVSRYPFRHREIPGTGPIHALTVASLQEYKGHEVLFRAVALGGPVMERLKLVLIGGGELESQLRELANELGIADRVEFRGSQTEAEVKDALNTCDLFVLPSIVARDGQMEGLPVALMEALASGAPTVSTRLSGIPELIVDGKTGFLAEPADPEDLRKAIARACESPGGAERAQAGRDLVADEFDLPRCIDSLAGLLQS